MLEKLFSIDSDTFFFAFQSFIHSSIMQILVCLFSTSITFVPHKILSSAFHRSSSLTFFSVNHWFTSIELEHSHYSALHDVNLFELSQVDRIWDFSQWSCLRNLFAYRCTLLLNSSIIRNAQSRASNIDLLCIVSLDLSDVVSSGCMTIIALILVCFSPAFRMYFVPDRCFTTSYPFVWQSIWPYNNRTWMTSYLSIWYAIQMCTYIHKNGMEYI